MRQKYLIDTEENKLFLKEMRENLLNFGHQFPAQRYIRDMQDASCLYNRKISGA